MTTSSITRFSLAPPVRRRPIISLTPLIDVVFILLIFFMLASSFLEWRAIDLDPPVQAAAATSSDGAVVVEIDKEGLALDGRPVTFETLAERVTAARADKPESPVLIQPSEGIPLQQAVDVLDTLQAAGIEGITLTRGGGA